MTRQNSWLNRLLRFSKLSKFGKPKRPDVPTFEEQLLASGPSVREAIRFVSEEGSGLCVSEKVLALKSRMDKYTGKGFFHAVPENLAVTIPRRKETGGTVDDVG